MAYNHNNTKMVKNNGSTIATRDCECQTWLVLVPAPAKVRRASEVKCPTFNRRTIGTVTVRAKRGLYSYRPPIRGSRYTVLARTVYSLTDRQL